MCKMFVIDIGLVSQWTDCIMIIDKIFKNVQIVGTIHNNRVKEHPKISRNAKFGGEMF